MIELKEKKVRVYLKDRFFEQNGFSKSVVRNVYRRRYVERNPRYFINYQGYKLTIKWNAEKNRYEQF